MRRLLFLVVSIALISSGSVRAQEGQANDAGVSLSERVKTLEERLEKLDKVEVVKQVVEYMCPGGEIYDSLPPDGHCPDGSVTEERKTFKKIAFSRRESLSEKIEAALQEAEAKRVVIGGSARGILQQVIHSREEDKLFGEGSVDFFFLSRPMAGTIFFADLEAVGGAGPDEAVGSLSRLNTDAETFGVGVTDQVKVREAWLHMSLMGDRVKAVVGKIDLTNYFDRNSVANDETAKFLNTALVNNPLLAQPPNGPGLAVRYEPGREIGAGIGLQSPDNSGSTIVEKVYAIAELDYHTHLLFAREGNYRFWGKIGRDADDLDNKTWGVGISLDQQMSTRITAFARAGVGRTEDESRNAHAWSTGLEIGSPFKALIKDRAGFAFSRQVEEDGSESIGEGYYNHFLTERLAVAFDLQWLFSGKNQITGEKNENLLIPGFRTTINF
ncbi:MAG: carbohydrate porin [Nitrospirae bacterium]|nr:carbohydrate porin [Nitrospirota bacterium]